MAAAVRATAGAMVAAVVATVEAMAVATEAAARAVATEAVASAPILRVHRTPHGQYVQMGRAGQGGSSIAHAPIGGPVTLTRPPG